MFQRFRRAAEAPAAVEEPSALPSWARPLFASPVVPLRCSADGEPLVWGIKNDRSEATISDQFKAHAEDYHLRYSASDHFEALFR